jgi:4-diphosphocytidyl-2-C-methyl-D-erythritol kinase
VTVTLIAPAKLTTELRIVGVRRDGYHLIDAEMVTLDLADRLEVSPSDTTVVELVGVVDVVGAAGGPPVPAGAENLVARALSLAGRTAHVRLHKVIPAGAGLGGASADAAAILRWCGLVDPRVVVSVGADVPFCVVGGRARVRGIGEQVEPLPWVDTVVTLLTPPIPVATPDVYRAWDELGGPSGPAGNDLEPAALVVEPRLARWRDALAERTAQRPRLAGSGGTWFVAGDHGRREVEVDGLVATTVVARTTGPA